MSKSVWDDLYDDPVEALDKKKRSALLIEIIRTGRTLDQSLSELALSMGATNNRAKALMAGHIDKFSVEDLSEICTNLGLNPEAILQEFQ